MRRIGDVDQAEVSVAGDVAIARRARRPGSGSPARTRRRTSGRGRRGARPRTRARHGRSTRNPRTRARSGAPGSVTSQSIIPRSIDRSLCEPPQVWMPAAAMSRPAQRTERGREHDDVLGARAVGVLAGATTIDGWAGSVASTTAMPLPGESGRSGPARRPPSPGSPSCRRSRSPRGSRRRALKPRPPRSLCPTTSMFRRRAALHATLGAERAPGRSNRGCHRERQGANPDGAWSSRHGSPPLGVRRRASRR